MCFVLAISKYKVEAFAYHFGTEGDASICERVLGCEDSEDLSLNPQALSNQKQTWEDLPHEN